MTGKAYSAFFTIFIMEAPRFMPPLTSEETIIFMKCNIGVIKLQRKRADVPHDTAKEVFRAAVCNCHVCLKCHYIYTALNETGL